MHEPADIGSGTTCTTLQGVSVYSLPSYHNHCLVSPADSRVEAAKGELAAKSSDRGYHWQRPPPREASEQSHRKLTQNRGSLPEVSSYGA